MCVCVCVYVICFQITVIIFYTALLTKNIFKQIYLTHRWDPNKYYHFWFTVELGVMIMKEYFSVPSSSCRVRSEIQSTHSNLQKGRSIFKTVLALLNIISSLKNVDYPTCH